MCFDWTEEQLQFRDAVAAFGRSLGDIDLGRRDRTAEFDRVLWRRCAEFGIQGAPIPMGP